MISCDTVILLKHFTYMVDWSKEVMTEVLFKKVQHHAAICSSSVFLQMLDKRESVDL